MSYHCSIYAIKETGPNGKGPSAWYLQKLKEIEDQNFILHPFKSLDVMIRELELQPSKFAHWRLVKCQLGHINGLPKSRGLLVAASGVNCLIWTGLGYYIGHKDFWVRELNEVEEVEVIEKPKKNRVSKNQFLNDLANSLSAKASALE